jgi:hypothetical protein
MDAEHQQEYNDRQGQSLLKLQQVCTLSAKKAVVEWMVEDSTWNTERRLICREIQVFPEHFRGSPKANYMKAYRWWIDQDSLLNLANNANPTPLYVTRAQVGKLCKTRLKTCSGRGWKRAAWMMWLYAKMVEEFDRLWKIGLILSTVVVCFEK